VLLQLNHKNTSIGMVDQHYSIFDLSATAKTRTYPKMTTPIHQSEKRLHDFKTHVIHCVSWWAIGNVSNMRFPQ
jgi:hypothetical protein